MTYKQGAEIVLRKLAGGDIPDEFPVKEEEVYLIISQIAPLLMRRDFFETFNLDKSSIDPTLFTTITAKVYKGEGRGESYVILPSAPVIMLGSMVPSVSYTKDRFVSFNYVDVDRLERLMSSGVLGEFNGYYFTYEYIQDCENEHRLVFFNLEDCVDKLKVRLVQGITIDDIDANAHIPLKSELVYMLLDECYKWFAGQDAAAEDKVNDDKNNNNIS